MLRKTLVACVLVFCAMCTSLFAAPNLIEVGRPYASIDARGVFVSLIIKNTGTESTDSNVIVYANEAVRRLTPVGPGKKINLVLRLKGSPSDIKVRVLQGDKMIAEAILCPPAASDQPTKRIANSQTALDFNGASRVSSVNVCSLSNGKTAIMGKFRPLGVLAYKDSSGVFRYLELSSGSLKIDGDRATLESDYDVEGGKASVKWVFSLPQGAAEGSMDTEVTVTAPIEVLRFEGPRLLAGDGSFGANKTHALFPGLEYLGKNEPSSNVKHVGPLRAQRQVPHPYTITVPLMAVEAEGGVVGISWDPLSEWAPGRSLPCAQFESPNTSPGSQNSLLTIFAPSVLDEVPVNSDFAKTPYVLKPDGSLKLSASFFARANQQITDVIPSYYATHGMPHSPPVRHGIDGSIDLCFKAYAGSMYSREKRGWKKGYGPDVDVEFSARWAANVLIESLRKNDPELARSCHIPSNAQISRFGGTTLDWFSEGAKKKVDSTLAKQLPDGGFPYEISDYHRKRVIDYQSKSGVKTETLGDLGKVYQGVIANSISGVLSYAIKTGNMDYAKAALKSVDRMNKFTVPRGAQTWEVHAHTPDIYGASLAMNVNMSAYELTGDAKYLEYARFWAYTGLPFIYGWKLPIDPTPKSVLHTGDGDNKGRRFDPPSMFYEDTNRYVTPGASIAVFGTSLYAVTWFGVPVQWCGMKWAGSVKRYCRFRPDPLLESIADMVFASCTQQQIEKGYLAGKFPDAWNLVGNMVYSSFIVPDAILGYAYGLKGEHVNGQTDTIPFNLRGKRTFLNTYAVVEESRTGPDNISVRLKYFTDQDVYTCVAQVPRPVKVTVDAQPLVEVSDIKSGGPGFQYDQANRALHIKYRVPSRVAELSINW